MRRAESDLLDLWEKLIHNAVKHHLANGLEWHEFLWPNFGRIKNVKIEVMLPRLRDDLNCELPFGIRATLYSLLKILAMEIYA